MSSGECPPSRSLLILPSAIRELDKIPLFTALFTVEIVVTLTGMALCLLAYQCRMQLKVHTNLRRIVSNVALTFTFLGPTRFVLIAMTMNWESDEDLGINEIYRFFDFFRLFYVKVAAFMLPAAAVERFYSVLYIQDYEAFTRSKISTAIIIVQHVVSLALILFLRFYNGCISLLPLILMLFLTFLTNIIAGLLFLYYYRVTMRYHDANMDYLQRRLPYTYSLSARFQVAENIRVVEMIKTLATFTFGFVLVLVVVSTVPFLVQSPLATMLSVQASFIGFAVYANVIPVAILLHAPGFMDKCRTALQQFRNRRVNKESDSTSGHSLASPFKRSSEEEAKIYFNQFDRMWS